MTLAKWRTTKIPEYYFNEIETTISSSQRYVSVSEFIRQAIEEKLSKMKTNTDFLIVKDLIFTTARIKNIHQIICSRFRADSKGLLKEDIQQVIDRSLDIDMITFLSRFTKNFAEYHPFKDGNKRTLLVTVDAFLRMNNLKLKFRAEKNKETEDEIFFWQNSDQQRTLEQIKKFIKTHLDTHKSSHDVGREIKKSIQDNRLILEKLSR
ncbi:MAG: Fic family protein [Nanoarchaeota archaeon]|nr:Fic family protein [Nanoarchaeota archaeon]